MSKNELSHAEMGDFRPQGKSEMRPAEKLLWELVRDRGMGVEFFWRRKVDQYVLNFFCEEGKLVIDLQPADGSAERFFWKSTATRF